MECFDKIYAYDSIIAAALIVAGLKLMSTKYTTNVKFGALCLGVGYLLLAITASHNSVLDMNSKKFFNKRTLMAIASAVLIVSGFLLSYYHFNDSKYANLSDDQKMKQVPASYKLMLYAGFIGLLLTISMQNTNSFDLVKAALTIGALYLILNSHEKLLYKHLNNGNANMNEIFHLIGWVLLVGVVSYVC